MTRKIGVLEPVWNQKPFVYPHFKQLIEAGVDKIVVLKGKAPLPQYSDEHGYSFIEDNTFKIINKHFPQIEIYDSTYYGMFGAPLYNEGLKYVQDMDIVLTLDTDMLFTKKDITHMIDFIRNSNYDCYRLNYVKNSINYYKDFDHGLMDAREMDPRAINPQYKYEWVLNYPHGKQYVMEWEGFMCHHFRGWNKPKSITSDWENTDYAKEAFSKYSNNGDWFRCPKEIKDMFRHEDIINWFKHVCAFL